MRGWIEGSVDQKALRAILIGGLWHEVARQSVYIARDGLTIEFIGVSGMLIIAPMENVQAIMVQGESSEDH